MSKRVQVNSWLTIWLPSSRIGWCGLLIAVMAVVLCVKGDGHGAMTLWNTVLLCELLDRAGAKP